jgi:NAD-dependent deacetylase sirtuin 5
MNFIKLRVNLLNMMKNSYSTDVGDFRKVLDASKHLVVLTGAGISAESGIPTFRGEGGFWRNYKAQVFEFI